MDMKGKTKDNNKARIDCAAICSRPNMAIDASGKKPRALYCRTHAEEKHILLWIKNEVKFLDGYAANIRTALTLIIAR